MADPPVPAPANPAQDENADPAPADPYAPAPNQPAQQILLVFTCSKPTCSTSACSKPTFPNAACQIIHQQVLNWSHFKPEFAGGPEEDVEVHLLCTNDSMVTHNVI